MTEPIKGVIPRELESGMAGLLDEFSRGIEETVNFGSHILHWDATINRGGDENFPPALLFRHFLELIDSVSILVKSSSIDPCKLILRGALEVYFSLEYIFEKDSNDRAMAFLVWHVQNRMQRTKKFDPTREQGKQLQNAYKKDKLIGGYTLRENPQIEKEILNLEELLKTPIYQKAAEEYERMKNTDGKNPPWYRLYNGPRNIEGLANYLNLIGIYEMLYRNWSGPTHGTDVIQGKVSDNPLGGTNIVQIRFAKDAQDITSQSLFLVMHVFKKYIEKRIPEKYEDFRIWYVTSIRDFNLKVSSKERLITII